MEFSTTVRAESVEKAIKIGLTKLNITADEASINVISEGKKGLFGFGKQDAIVEVSKNQKVSYQDLTHDVKEEIKADQEPLKTSETIVEVIEPKVVEIPKIEKVEEVQEVLIKEIEEPKESELVSQHEKVAKYLEDVIRDYGADAKITVTTGKNKVIFNIETEKSGLIIGKHGKIINALQILAQIMVHQYDKRRQSIILNIGDYRDRRANVLEQIAERTAKEVLRTKRSVVLDPLPSYERKQIHAYLSKVEHIETYSEGRDPNRYLVVEYKA